MLTTSSQQRFALDAAPLAGDREAALRIAASPGRDEKPYDFEYARGAVLCAFGDRSQGAAALLRADEMFGGSDGHRDAKLSLIACDPTSEPELASIWRSNAEYIRMIAGGPAMNPRATGLSSDPIPTLVALSRAGETRRGPYLVQVAGTGGKLMPTWTPLSPWSILASPTDYPEAPAWTDEAAARLIALADAADRPEPLADIDTFRILDEAQSDPAPHLRWGAMILALDAAVGLCRVALSP